MTIEILCSGCDDCQSLRGKVCQALADLNLAADVISIDAPYPLGQYYMPGNSVLVIDGQPVAASGPFTVSELKTLLNEKATNR